MKRNSIIDLAKGILILIVMFHHISFQASMAGINNGCIQWNFTFLRLYAPWFMPAFFLLSGFCSNFDKPFGKYCIDNLRTIIWPSITFYFIIQFFAILQVGIVKNYAINMDNILLCGFNWFLTSLFIAKTIYWIIRRFVKNERIRIGLLLLFSIIAIICNDFNIFGNNWLHYRHSLYLMFFLELGTIYHERYSFIKKTLLPSLILFISFIFISYYNDYNSLGIAGIWISFSFYLTSIQIVVAILGINSLLYLCEMISSFGLLEYIGRKSLIFYLFHATILGIIVRFTDNYIIDPQNRMEAFFFNLTVMVLTCLICLLISRLMSYKYLRSIIIFPSISNKTV